MRDVDLKSKLKWLYELGTKLPPVVRWPLGLALIAGGLIGAVVPILGLWMVPLGLMFMPLDIPPVRKKFTVWLEKHS